MNPEVKGRWCAALESDEYRQGVSQLRTDTAVTDVDTGETTDGEEFCCLGVLTDLWIKEDPEHRRWMTVAEANEAGTAVAVVTFAGVTSVSPTWADLPRVVQVWADVPANPEVSFSPDLADRLQVDSLDLASVNDDFVDEVDFPTIAKIIREDPDL